MSPLQNNFQKKKISCAVFGFHSPFSRSKVLFFPSGLSRSEAETVPVHHHAWTFFDFLWRSSPEPDRQRRGSPAKSPHCRHSLSFPPCSIALSSSPSTVAVVPRSFGDAPACLPLRLNPSNHVVLWRWIPAPSPYPLLPTPAKITKHTLLKSIETKCKRNLRKHERLNLHPSHLTISPYPLSNEPRYNQVNISSPHNLYTYYSFLSSFDGKC